MLKTRHRLRLFPFDAAMTFGFGILKLSPHSFWAMTPRELRAAQRVFARDHKDLRFTPSRLADLMAQYPDDDVTR